MKKVIKFSFDGKEGFLSLVEIASHQYALVHKNTPKVDSILKTHQLAISLDLKKDTTYHLVEANVSMDATLIEQVYRQLELEKNLYFKQLDDSLCVIEFNLKA